MVDDSMKSNKFIGMVQPKTLDKNEESPNLYNVGCLGKIVSFQETKDGRYLIELKGLVRFNTVTEIENKKKYREFQKKI